MNFIDPHVHMYSRTTDDYEKMSLSGIKTVIEPSFWLGQQRTSYKTLEDYWEHIISFERQRAMDFGIDHYCAISVNPKEANNKKFAEDSIAIIKNYLSRDSVIALGEIGFDMITKQEEDVFRKQLGLADELKIPIIIHTPHVNKLEGTKRTFDKLKKRNFENIKLGLDEMKDN